MDSVGSVSSSLHAEEGCDYGRLFQSTGSKIDFCTVLTGALVDFTDDYFSGSDFTNSCFLCLCICANPKL